MVRVILRNLLVILTIAPAILLSACGIIHVKSTINEPCGNPCGTVTRATFRQPFLGPNNNNFIGIALSGGGSRAAYFSAAVLQELEELGFLKYTTAISSVSGGSLTAAYLALHWNRISDPSFWTYFKDLLSKDLVIRGTLRMLAPHNIFKYFFTDFDRSDIMAAVFDNIFFNGKTFGDLSMKGPHLILNATELVKRDTQYCLVFS